jgi:hypothetical protein
VALRLHASRLIRLDRARRKTTKEEEAMRQILWPVFLVAIACALTAAILAQAPRSAAPEGSKPVTFSGCIEKAPADPAAAPAAAAASTTFILTNASPSGSGTVGTAGSPKPAAKYRLDADEAKLAPHVGHKVEITGTVDEQSVSPSAPGGAVASAATSPKFKVDSVKMVAAACP